MTQKMSQQIDSKISQQIVFSLVAFVVLSNKIKDWSTK
jgi:hypothetical protein